MVVRRIDTPNTSTSRRLRPSTAQKAAVCLISVSNTVCSGASARQGVKRLQRRLLRLAEQLEQHVVLGRKVEIEGSAAHLGLQRDVLDAAVGNAVTTEDLDRRVVELLPRLFSLFVAHEPMCTLIVSFQQHPSAPLIIAANRDELRGRPASRAASMAGRTLRGAQGRTGRWELAGADDERDVRGRDQPLPFRAVSRARVARHAGDRGAAGSLGHGAADHRSRDSRPRASTPSTCSTPMRTPPSSPGATARACSTRRWPRDCTW